MHEEECCMCTQVVNGSEPLNSKKSCAWMRVLDDLMAGESRMTKS